MTEVDHKSRYASALDGKLEGKRQEHEELMTQVGRYAETLGGFLKRCEEALNEAADVINARSAELGLDQPLVVTSTLSKRSEVGPVSGTLHVAFSRLQTGSQPGVFSWTLSVLGGPPRDEAKPILSITAQRNHWRDMWNSYCEFPTEECNPSGLSVEATGEDVAGRFMEWFVRYIA